MRAVITASFGAMLLARVAVADVATVTESNMQGWAFQVTSIDGLAELVDGPATPPAGRGSAHLHVGSQGDESVQVRHAGYAGTRLDELTSLAYATYTLQWNVPSGGGQAPYIILNLDHDGDGDLDDLLFFEPEYQSGVYRPDIPVQGPNDLGAWRQWDALAGGWWSPFGHAGAGPGSSVKTIAEYLASAPDATIINTASGLGGVRIVSGFASPTDVFESHVDAVTIGVGGVERTYDFEHVLVVEVDLRPATTDAQVNTNAKQIVPVAILGSDGFDPVSEVDPETVVAAGAPALPTRFDTTDVDGDGFADLTLYFRARSMTKPTSDECADPDARIVVSGSLADGTRFEGSDHVQWIGPDCS